MLMDVVEIQKYLPHRYPFLMIDGILEVEKLKRIVGVKCVTINEAHFQGHFPGQPVMPGVLIIESMAQTGKMALKMGLVDGDAFHADDALQRGPFSGPFSRSTGDARCSDYRIDGSEHRASPVDRENGPENGP